jgi:hypothetical protein
MTDQESKVRLTAVDNTAKALASATANFKKTADQMAKALGLINTEYTRDLPPSDIGAA